ncbi:MAG: hypothetical protein ACLQDV_01635 [Candidatus Binataceae bacterium]
MSWPLKLRAISFVIGMGVVVAEVSVVAIPVGVALWAAGFAGAARIAQVEMAIAFAIAFAIIVPAHIRPTRIATPRQGASR